MAIKKVELSKAYRLINHGATTLISAKFEDALDVMAASWACPLDYDKVSVVIDSGHFTRKLIDKSGRFAVQIPTASLAKLTLDVGEISKNDEPNKLEICGVRTFYEGEFDVPLVNGCAAWLICEILPQSAAVSEFDLLLAKVVAAYADDEIFENGRWKFDEKGDEWRSLHYIAGRKFYTIGKSLEA